MFFLLPIVSLSGFIVLIENMPAVIQPLDPIPLRPFLVILRSIFSKASGSKGCGRKHSR